MQEMFLHTEARSRSESVLYVMEQNERLQRLVSELLRKNQELRSALSSPGSGDSAAGLEMVGHGVRFAPRAAVP